MSDFDPNSRLTSPLLEDGNVEATSLGATPVEHEDDGTGIPAIAEMDMDDDLGSDLSEVDEAEFDDFDPTTVALEDRPIQEIDEEAARTLKAGKKKGTTEGKKPKEGKRDRKKRRRDEDEDPDGERLEGKRIRKPRPDSERKSRDGGAKDKKVAPEDDDAKLTPEERRVKALDKKMDMALKNPNKRRRKKDEVVSNPRLFLVYV
jgi:transcription factor SPN1